MQVKLSRYANRKIYRPGMSAVYGYCTFSHILGMIKAGTEVVIVDHRTKRDITEEVLNNLNHKMFPLSKEELVERFRGTKK